MMLFFKSECHQIFVNGSHPQRYLVSLLLSLGIISFILIIPLSDYLYDMTESTIISVELTKPLEPSTPEEIEPNKSEKPEPIKETEPAKPSIQHPQKVVDKTKKKPEKQTVTQQVPQVIKNTQSTIKAKVLPSYGQILNSMEGTNKLFTIDKDFQAAKTNADDFIMKQMLPPKESKFIVHENTIGLNVGDGQPLSLKILKGLAKKFSLVPIDDQERNRDTLNYCPSLGRKSVFCPNDNPLVY